ncbi:GNAT family N-acetyltransferase [Sphingomonas changnyeongensis]|uniref:GNAT family N-acetyltransferase n=1 Tax=Sphingomonas changnyeongensis TaxID=2698679 RepID=UPI001E414724|nr:N-acetyltransferase [Sphingomonas changnyeongensis]
MFTLSPLADADPVAIETLLDAAFGTDRHGRTAYRLRTGSMAIEPLSFAAWIDGQLAGSLQSWPVELAVPGEGAWPLVMVGPVAVAPAQQGLGIGKALMAALVDAFAAGPWTGMMMIGDPEYYGRFGFAAAPATGWRIDGPYEQRRLLARLKTDYPATGDLRAAIRPANSAAA